MANQAKKVVLVSRLEYSERYDSLLRTFIEDEVEVFCCLGVDCRRWEDAMDSLWEVSSLRNPSLPLMVTSSHPGESLDEVIEFAKIGMTATADGKEGVRVIEI